MRFDEYLQRNAIAAAPADRFNGFEVNVQGPHGWEAVEDRPGLRIWVWREDPYREKFCANAVLTMHQVAAALDPADTFEMLSEEQVLSAPKCQELQQRWESAEDGIGIQGTLSSQVDTEFGTIDSLTRTRIIVADQQTLIAQLTLTALHGSPVDWDEIQMSLQPVPAQANTATVADPDEHATAIPTIGS